MHHFKFRAITAIAATITLGLVAGTAVARSQQNQPEPQTQLPADLQSAKTVWVPIHVVGGMTSWSDTYQLYIDGQRVQTPVGDSVGGFIKSGDGGYLALVHMEAGSQAYRQLQQGTFQGEILTPNMQAPHPRDSIVWAFYKLDASGRAQEMLGVAACAREGSVRGTVRTEVTDEGLYCHEAFTSNDKDSLVGVAADDTVLHGPTGYAQIFAAKDYFVGMVRTVVDPGATCTRTMATREYWTITKDDGRWARGTQLLTTDESRNLRNGIDRVKNASVYVDLPSYSPTSLSNVVTYQSSGEQCSSSWNLGAPDTIRAQGLLDDVAQWVSGGAEPAAAKQFRVVMGNKTAETGAGDAPNPLGAGLVNGAPYGLYVVRDSGGRGLMSAVLGGKNAIGLEFRLRSFTSDDNRKLFTPAGRYELNYVSIQTPGNLYVVPIDSKQATGKAGSAGQAYDAAASQWIAADPVRAWMSKYSISQARQ